MPTDYTDGTILSDSFVQEIDSKSYVVNNLSLTAPTVEATRTNEKGAVAAWKAALDDGNITGTAELQTDVADKVKDLRFKTFQVPADANPLGIAIWLIITAITNTVTIGQSRTLSVNVRKLINAPAGTPPGEE